MQVTDIIKLVVVLIIVGVVIFHLTSCYLKNKPVEQEKPIDKREFLKTIEVLSSEDGSDKTTIFTGRPLKEAIPFEEWASLNMGQRLVLHSELLAGQTLSVKFDEFVEKGFNIYRKAVDQTFGNLMAWAGSYELRPTIDIHEEPASIIPNFLGNLTELSKLFGLNEGLTHVKKYKLNKTILTVFEYCVYVLAVEQFNNLVRNRTTVKNDSVSLQVFSRLKDLHHVDYPKFIGLSRYYLTKGPDKGFLLNPIHEVGLTALNDFTIQFVQTFKKADKSFLINDEQFKHDIDTELKGRTSGFSVFDPSESLRFGTFVKENILANKKDHITDILVPVDVRSPWEFELPRMVGPNLKNIELDKDDIVTLDGIRFRDKLFDVLFSKFKPAEETIDWLLKTVEQWLSPNHTAYKELLALKPVVQLMSVDQKTVFNIFVYEYIIYRADDYFKRNPVEFTKRVSELTEALGTGNPFIFFHARREWNKRMFMLEFERSVTEHDCATVATDQLMLAREQLTNIMELKELTHDQQMAWSNRSIFLPTEKNDMFPEISNPFSYFEQINNLYDDLFNRVKQPSVEE